MIGPDGRRSVPVEDIVTGPGETSLSNGEIVISFDLPERPPRSGDAYLRFTPRTEMDIAVVGVGVNLTLDEAGHHALTARVSLGAVAERPLLVEEAAADPDRKSGSTTQRWRNCRSAASAACRPIDDKRGTREFRIEVAGVLAERAARIAVERAEQK